MAFRKGFSGNPNGRPKGRRNKHDAELKTMLFSFSKEQINHLPSFFDELNIKDKVSFLLKILPYVTSKMLPQNDDIDDSDNTPQDMRHVPTEEIVELVKLMQKTQEIKKKYNLR